MKQSFIILSLLLCCFFYTIPVKAQKKDFSNCTQAGCHHVKVQYENVHSPVEDGCESCHQIGAKDHPVKKKDAVKLVESVPELCQQCHDIPMSGKSIHPPTKSGECLNCHNPHGSDNESLLIDDAGTLCATCHDSYVTREFVHGPVAGGMCTGCHNPHASEYAKLLSRTGQDVCLFCHTAKKDIQSKASVHEPFVEGCMDCHTPHNSNIKYLLVTDVPQLCYECHQTVEVALANKSEVHGPFQEGGKCYLCHNAHVSDFSPLLQMEEKQLCFQCHNKKIKKDGRTIRDIEQDVNANFVHAPVANDGCSACHAAHTPNNYFLLSSAFPAGSYTEGKVENFAHCFDCHDSALMEQAETTSATGFRNGNRNLHYVHVTREKARNCTTCHRTHGSKYEHLIADKVPFGNWEMPMKFTVTASGGSCLTGCHQELGYNR